MNQDLYKIFNNRLKDASQPYPRDLWDKIQPELPTYGKATNKKGGWLWMSLLALLILSVSFWTQPDNKTEVNAELASLMPIPSNQNADPSQNASALAQPIDITKSNSETKETIEKQKTNDIIEESPSNTQSGKTQSSPILKDINNTQRNVAANSQNIFVQSKRNNSNESLLEKQEDLLNTNQTPTSLVENLNTPTSSYVRNSGTRITSTIALLQPSTTLLEGGSETIIEMQPDPSCYSFSNRHQSTYSADVYVGYGYGLRPMNSRDEDVTPYIDARKATESYKYLFTAGVRLNMMMNNGFAFRGGLHYTQIGEKFDYTDSSSFVIITQTPFTVVGNDTIFGTPVEVIQPGTTIKSIHNRYHSLDIPLLVGYDVPLGRMHASLSAGAVINISAWQRGQFLDPSLEPANINIDEQDDYYPAYKTTLGVSAYLSASLAVPISKNIWLFGEPYVLHRFDPVTFDEYSIKQGNTNFGINVGLKLKL